MKLAVFSDIHGNLVAFEAMLADLESVGDVDMIWMLGDIAAFGARPVECIRKVRELGEKYGEKKFKAIGGNTDRYLVTGERMKISPAKDEATFKQMVKNFANLNTALDWNLSRMSWEDYEYLSKILGKETSLKVDGYGYVIGYHAVPGSDEPIFSSDTPLEEADDYLLDREGHLAIGAHIHVQMDRQLTRWRAINVGSVGMSFDMPGKAQWGLFTFENGNVAVDLRAVPYDTAAAIADLKAVNFPLVDWAKSRMKLG